MSEKVKAPVDEAPVDKKQPDEDVYWLPEFGISIKASSYNEAVEKAKEASK